MHGSRGDLDFGYLGHLWSICIHNRRPSWGWDSPTRDLKLTVQIHAACVWTAPHHTRSDVGFTLASGHCSQSDGFQSTSGFNFSDVGCSAYRWLCIHFLNCLRPPVPTVPPTSCPPSISLYTLESVVPPVPNSVHWTTNSHSTPQAVTTVTPALLTVTENTELDIKSVIVK